MSEDKKMDHTRWKRLDDPERKKKVPPEKIVELVAPFPGMVFADLGCGTGFATFPVAKAVSGEGTFYGLDAQAPMLEVFRQNRDRSPYAAAIRPVLTPDNSIALEDESVDVLFMLSVYHELPDRDLYTSEFIRVLKKGGRLVIVDWQPLEPGQPRVSGPPAHHRVSVDQVQQELAKAGFAALELVDAFPGHWTVTAKKP